MADFNDRGSARTEEREAPFRLLYLQLVAVAEFEEEQRRVGGQAVAFQDSIQHKMVGARVGAVLAQAACNQLEAQREAVSCDVVEQILIHLPPFELPEHDLEVTQQSVMPGYAVYIPGTCKMRRAFNEGLFNEETNGIQTWNLPFLEEHITCPDPAMSHKLPDDLT